MPSFGGGPGARARPGLRAEGCTRQRARPRGARRPAPASLTGRHTGPQPEARPSDPARARLSLSLDRSPQDGRNAATSAARPASPPTTLQRPRRLAATTAPSARPRAGTAPRRKKPAPGGRAPPPTPGADAAEARAGVASTRGLPVGETHRRRGRTPGTAAAASRRRAPFRGPTPGGRPAALSRGAPPTPLVSTRGLGGEAPPRPPASLPSGPHVAGKGDGEATGRARAGTAAGDGRRLPADRPPGGTLAERRRHPPLGTGSPALAGPPATEGPPSAPRPDGRAARPGPAGGRHPPRCVRGGKAVEGRGAVARPTRRHTPDCGGGRGER